MPRLCMLLDAAGLTFDDLWSYYEVLGRPAWVPLSGLLMLTAALAAVLVA